MLVLGNITAAKDEMLYEHFKRFAKFGWEIDKRI
jgi:hypothetical protein